VLEAIRETQKSRLTKTLLLSGLRAMGNMRYWAVELGISWAAGSGVRPLDVSGLLVMQSRIVLHFISKEVLLEGSIVFKNGGFCSPQGWQ
jgi:hypothetical protein